MCVSACQLGILGNLVLCRLMSCRPFSCYIKDATTLPLSRNNTTSLPKATYTPPRCLKIYRTRIEIESQSNRSCKRRINTSLLGLSAVDPGSQESPWMMIIASRDGTRTYTSTSVSRRHFGTLVRSHDAWILSQQKERRCRRIQQTSGFYK